MSDASEIANRLLRNIANISQEETFEEQSFSSVVAATRQNFRRDSPYQKRGRKRKPHFSTSVFLMKLAHAEFGPGKAESNFLKNRGLGLSTEKLIVFRNKSLQEIKNSIIQLYPENIQSLLTMCDFKLGKLSKCRKIELLENIQTGNDLEAQLKQGILIILPLKDFPSNLPVLRNESTSTPHRRATMQLSSLRSQSFNIDEDSDFSDHHSTNADSPTVIRTSRNRARAIAIPRSTEEVNMIEDKESEEEEIAVATEVVKDFLIIPEISEDAETIKVSISRQNCLHELLNFYQDETIINKNLNVEFLGEPGVDGGGLTKELFNIFFAKCTEHYFRGEDCLIPHLELNQMKDIDNFVIIGRILQHMLLLTQTIPSKLSKITLMLIGNPDKELHNDILIQELLNYVNIYLRKLLKKALKNYSSLCEKEIETIGEFFTSNHFWARPRSETIKEQLLIIASEILIEKPKKFITKIRQGVKPQNYPFFWNNCDFSILIDMQTPTPAKIVNCLKVDEHLTNEQSNIFHYFTMFINCLEKDKLLDLIFLITGSYVMPDFITVKFNDLVGLSQRPIFSTCSNTITLPETYSCYSNLKNDLIACINADEAREYNTY